MKKIIGLALLVFLWGGQAWACPSAAKIAADLAGGRIKVLKVQPSPVPGICEVVVKARGQKRLIYSDASGRFIFVGRIIDTVAKKDITAERLKELLRLSPEQMKKLDSLVDFSMGKGPVVYLITDPDCPFCRRAEQSILPLVEKGEITLKVILLPLERIHPHSKEKAIGLICDSKGLKEMLAGYQGSQCEKGRQKVEENEKILFSLGIRATPTYVFSNGQIISGALPGEKVLSLARGAK